MLLDLTDVEFGLLQALMRSAGEVVAREQLAETVLGRKFHPFDRSLDMHVSRLRHKLDAADNFGDRVKTIRGVGYQLAVPAPRKLQESDRRCEDSSPRSFSVSGSRRA